MSIAHNNAAAFRCGGVLNCIAFLFFYYVRQCYCKVQYKIRLVKTLGRRIISQFLSYYHVARLHFKIVGTFAENQILATDIFRSVFQFYGRQFPGLFYIYIVLFKHFRQLFTNRFYLAAKISGIDAIVRNVSVIKQQILFFVYFYHHRTPCICKTFINYTTF